MSCDGKTDVPTVLTRAERVVGTLELLARREILTLRGDALEVVRVILEAIHPGRLTVNPEESMKGYDKGAPMSCLVGVGEPG